MMARFDGASSGEGFSTSLSRDRPVLDLLRVDDAVVLRLDRGTFWMARIVEGYRWNTCISA